MVRNWRDLSRDFTLLSCTSSTDVPGDIVLAVLLVPPAAMTNGMFRVVTVVVPMVFVYLSLIHDLFHKICEPKL